MSAMNVKRVIPISFFPLFILLLDIILLVWAIIQGYQDNSPMYYFKEGRLITFLSSFHLIAIAMLCWVIYESERGQSASNFLYSPSLIWLLMSLGFLFLAFDEVLSIHENIDISLHRLLDMKETALTDRIDDVLIFVYALLGLMAIFLYRSQLVKYFPFVIRYFMAGFLLLLLTIVLDILTNRRDIVEDRFWYTLLSVCEESMKIVAEYLFLAVAYRCNKYSDSPQIK